MSRRLVIEGDVSWHRGGHIKVDSYPPDGWDDLDTVDQLKLIYEAIGQEIEVNSVQFKF